MPLTEQQLRNEAFGLQVSSDEQRLREDAFGIQRPPLQVSVLEDLPQATKDGVDFEDLLPVEQRELFKRELDVAKNPDAVRDKYTASLKLADDMHMSFSDAFAFFDGYAKFAYEGDSKKAASDLTQQLAGSVITGKTTTPEEIQERKELTRQREIELDPIKAFPEEFHSLNVPLNSAEWEQVRGKRRKPITPLSGNPYFSPLPPNFYKRSKIDQIALTMDARASMLQDDDPLKKRYGEWKKTIDLRRSLLAAPFIEVEKREKGGLLPEASRGAVSGLLDIVGRGLGLFAEGGAISGVFEPEDVAALSKELRKLSESKPLATPEGDSFAFQMGRVSAQVGAGFAAFFVTGQPLAFGLPIGILEYTTTLEETLAAGASQEQAELAATSVALINMAIEQWQFRTIRGFAGKGVKDAIRKRATNFTIKNALQFTGNVTLDTAKLAATGAIQEATQSVIAGGAVVIFDPTALENIPKQALMEGFYGAGAEVLFGGLGRVYTNAQTARANAQTRKAMVSLDEALIEDTGVAPEKATEIVNKAMDLSSKATDKDEAASVFLESVNEQLGTEEITGEAEEKSVVQEIAETERFEVIEPTTEAAPAAPEAEVPAEGVTVPPKPTGAITEELNSPEKLLDRIDKDGAGNKITDKLINAVFDKASDEQLSQPQSLLGKIRDILGKKVFDKMTPIEGALLNEFVQAKATDKSLTLSEFLKQKSTQAQPTQGGKFQIIDNETGEVLEFATKKEAESKAKQLNKELRQEQAGGIVTEQIKWKRKSGEIVETTRGELTTEVNRLTKDLSDRLVQNKINTEEDVKQAEADWEDLKSIRQALGLSKGAKPFKVIRAKGQEIKTIKNTKSRIWESIKPKTVSGLTTSQVINAVMKGMEKGARTGFIEGAREVVKNHKNLAAYAKARIKGLTVDNAILNKLLSAVSRSRTNAEQVSAMAAIEVVAQRAEHNKAVADLKKTVAFVNKKSGQVMQKGGVRPEFLERIQDVLNTFVFKRPSERKIKGRKQTLLQRAKSLKQHLEKIRSTLDSKYNREFAEELLPTRLIESAEKLGLTSLEDMTTDEINEINRDIISLLHQNSTKNRLILERVARNAAEDIKQMMAEADNVVDKKLIEVGDEVKPKPENALQKTIAVVGGRFNHDLETLIDTLGGGQFGILHNSVAQNFSDGRRKRDAFFNELDTFVETEMDKAGITLTDLQEMSPVFYRMFKGKKGIKFRDTVLAKLGIVPQHKTHEVILGGKRFNLTMAEIMSIYMHAQARFNLISMLRSGVAVKDGVTDVISRVKNIDITEIEAIDKIVRSNPKALRLTEIAAETYDTIFKDGINEVSIALKGIRIANEENYWHIQRYTGGGIAGTETYRISLLESEGRLQKREGSGNPVRINDFFAQTLADRQAIGEYIGMAKAYRAAKTLLNYRPWREKMELKGYGDEIKKLDTIIERTEQSQSTNYDIISGFTGKLLRGLVRSVLGNPVIMASQYVSAHGYFTETDAKYIRALRFLPFQKEVDRYRKNWTRYRTRMDGVVSSIALQELSGSDHALRVLAHKTDYVNLIISGIHKVDMMAITEAGRITEAEMADDKLSGKAKKYWDREGINPNTLEFESDEYWDAFNKRADYLVRRTQPMFDRENRSVLTGAETGLARSFVLFRSYIDQPLRMFSRNQVALANGQITKKEYAQQTGLILGGLYGYTMLRHILDKLIYQDDDDVSDMILEMIMSPAKLLTFIGFPFLKLAERVFDVAKGEKESFFTPEFDTVATSFLDSVLKNSAEIATGIGYFLQGDDAVFQSGPREGELKSTAHIADGVKGLFIDILTLIGIPTRTASKIYDGWLKDNEEVFKI